MTINEQIRSLCSRLRLYALPRLLESEAHLAQEQGKTHVEFLHDLLREGQQRLPTTSESGGSAGKA